MQIPNTAPLTTGEGLNKKKLRRRFLGNLFPRNGFDAAMLKAYIKGHSRFNYKSQNNALGQAAYEVMQEYYYE